MLLVLGEGAALEATLVVPVLAGPVRVNRHVAAVPGVLRLGLLVGDHDGLYLVQLLLRFRLVLIDVDSGVGGWPLGLDVPDRLWAHWRDDVALVQLVLVEDWLIGARLLLEVLKLDQVLLNPGTDTGQPTVPAGAGHRACGLQLLATPSSLLHSVESVVVRGQVLVPGAFLGGLLQLVLDDGPVDLELALSHAHQRLARLSVDFESRGALQEVEDA